jgi:hypothetical protein
MLVVKQPKQAKRSNGATNPALALVLQKQQRRPRPPQKQSKKKNNKQRAKKINSPPNHSMSVGKASECALLYASAILDPENTSEGACIPYGFPTPSMKQKVFTRGTFALGTTGQGYILYTPTVANDAIAITTTTAASVGTAATALSSFTGIATYNATKLMFATAEVVTNKTVAARFVAGCIKIRYAGTEANRNGTMCALEEPNHGNMQLQTGSTMRSYINSFVERPDPLGTFDSINYSGPVNATETQFGNVSQPVGNIIAIFVDGLAGDKYEWEMYQHVEFSGQNVPGVSVSHSDPIGYANLVETAKAVTVSEPLSDKNAPSAFVTFLKSTGTAIKDIAVKYGPDILSALSQGLMKKSPYMMVDRSRSLLKG